jgi:hypothetical protein
MVRVEKDKTGGTMEGIKGEQSERRRNLIRCGVLKLWERNEKCVKRLDSGEDLSCLVLKQRRRILVN